MKRFRSALNPQVAGMLLLLGATLAVSKVAEDRKPEPLALPLDSISRQIGAYSAVDNPPLGEDELNALKATSILSRTYRGAAFSLDVFIAFYASQRAGESMHSPKHCLPGSGWEIWNYGRTDIPVKGRTFTINQYAIEREGQRKAVLYWYQSKGRIIASEYEGKILLAKDALLNRSTAGSIVRIIVPDDPAAIQAARALAGGLIPRLQRCLGG